MTNPNNKSDTDFFTADLVEVTIDGDKLWVDIDGQNRFRVYRIKRLSVTDRRERASAAIWLSVVAFGVLALLSFFHNYNGGFP